MREINLKINGFEGYVPRTHKRYPVLSRQFAMGYRPRYWFNAQFYAFGELNFRVDQQVGIDREAGETLGVGYQLISSDMRSAYVEIGAGARQVSFSDATLEGIHNLIGRLQRVQCRNWRHHQRINICTNAGVSGD